MTDDVIERIIAKTGLSMDEVEKKIAMKQRELSDLVSREGAAYILAKELGLDIFTHTQKRLELKNVIPGIKNLHITARVLKVMEPRVFENDGKQSRVANVFLADGTAMIRMSLWDNQCENMEHLKEGMAVEIRGAYTKTDYKGEPEVRISRKGGIKILETSDLPEVNGMNVERKPEETTIDKMRLNEICEVRAAVVQMFSGNAFFEVCPTCGSRVKKDDNFTCKRHGKVEPKTAMVLSGVIDDGYANIRAVFFRDAALSVLGMTMDEALAKKETIHESIDVLGKEFVFSGKVRHNQMFGRLEFIVNNMRPVDIEAEINKLINDTRKS